MGGYFFKAFLKKVNFKVLICPLYSVLCIWIKWPNNLRILNLKLKPDILLVLKKYP